MERVGRLRRQVAGGVATWLVLLTALLGLAAGYALKAPCTGSVRLGDGTVALDWQDWRQYRDYCYSDTIPLYGLERLQEGGFPYKTAWQDADDQRTRYMEYPVVTGLLQYVVMRATKAYLSATGQTENPDPPEVVVYFRFMALVLAAAWVVAVVATAPLARRPRDVLLMTLSPVLAVHAFTNFDTLAVALAAGGLLAWARQRPILAGVLLGVGAAAKLYPLLVLGPLLALCWRTAQLGTWARAAYAAAAAWLAVNLPIALLYPEGWGEFFRLNSTRPADHDSVYNAISVLTGWTGFDGPLAPGASPERLNLITLLLFGLCCAGIAWIAATAPRRPRVASLVFLVVAAFLLTNKVWSPQYSLWLLPLAVLALPRVVPLAAWMVVDAYLWLPRLGYFLGLAQPGLGNSPDVFVRVVLLRDALVLLICVLVVRSIYRPDRDPVRAAAGADGADGADGEDVDDPGGGVLDGAPDRRGPAAARARRDRRARHLSPEPFSGQPAPPSA